MKYQKKYYITEILTENKKELLRNSSWILFIIY